MYNISAFCFVEETEKFDINEEGLIARIPSNTANIQYLFDLLTQELHFPYFGRNWDALNDLLNDLWWIVQKKIILIHDDLPLKQDAKNFRIYLEILLEAINTWKGQEKHEFVVVFPLAFYEKIEQILLQS